MKKSYDEIMNILTLMDHDDLKERVYLGSTSYFSSETQLVISNAVKDLAQRAMEYTQEKLLYVIAIGAITNVTSALLSNSAIKDRMVLIWLGGHAHNWPDNREFNLSQDVAVARIVFGCGIPLVQLLCMGVILIDVTPQEAKECYGGETWIRPIWDVCYCSSMVTRRGLYARLFSTQPYSGK